jgi:hypothetical protein
VGDLTFSVLALPYVATTVAVALLGGAGVLVRGDPVLRLAILTLAAVAIPWTVTFMLVGCTRDPQLAETLFRVGYGGAALAGPGLLMLVLGTSGRFDGYRHVVVVAYLLALVSAVLCWSTDWVVRGVHPTPSGFLYSTPGWMQFLHVGQIPLWGGIGMLISRRGMRPVRDDERWRAQRRRTLYVVILCSITLSDSLLAHDIAGYYPAAWLPILFAAAIALYGIARADLLRGRGLDVPAMVELAAMAVVLVLLMAATWGGNRTWMSQPLVTAVFLAPLPTFGLVAAWTLRIRRRRGERASDEASSLIDDFADEVGELAGEQAIAARLAEVLAAHAPLDHVRVWAIEEGGETRPLLGTEAAPPIDARVRAWLVANAEPLVVAELTSARLGGLRALIEEMVTRFAADALMPLVDRDSLIGIVAVDLPPYRVLRDDERDFVRAAVTTAARGLTFLTLTREADHLARTAREVELAEAVALARSTGDVLVAAGPWQLLAHYRPAPRVAGDVWSHAELEDGRVLLFLGDVVGRGVPSALVSAAVVGVCDAAPALAGTALTPRGLLELVHETVRDLGGGNQRVTALAALLDQRAGTVQWACAGHRGAYLVHPPGPDGDGRARLELLGARSTPLGDPTLTLAEGERALAADDLVVTASDGVVDVRGPRGDPWGERRLQRMLRDQLLAAGDRAARMVVAAAVAHAGDGAAVDDMLVVVVRPADS